MDAKQIKRALHTLHRYFIWANRMRIHFYGLVPKIANDPKPDRFTNEAIEADMYMSLWYGELYVVAEGFQELGLSDPTIDSLLASPNLDLLRRYRNGVFHFQKDYFDEHFIGFMRDGKNAASWVFDLNQAFGSFLLRELEHSGVIKS